MDIETILDLPDAEAWRPQPGDKIIGTVLGVDERTGDYEPYPCITIAEKGTGEVRAVHAFHSVLKGEVAKQSPQPGDAIGIVYRGIRESGRGNKYENYTVAVQRPDGAAATPAPDWKAHQKAAAVELEDGEEPF